MKSYITFNSRIAKTGLTVRQYYELRCNEILRDCYKISKYLELVINKHSLNLIETNILTNAWNNTCSEMKVYLKDLETPVKSIIMDFAINLHKLYLNNTILLTDKGLEELLKHAVSINGISSTDINNKEP